MKKLYRVIALPSKEKTNLVYDNITHKYYDPKLLNINENITYIHLYIISTQKIQENDYMLLKIEHPSGRIRKCYWIEDNKLYIDKKEDKGWGFCYRNEVYKILFSNNISLILPILSENFIKEFINLENTKSKIKLSILSYIKYNF